MVAAEVFGQLQHSVGDRARTCIHNDTHTNKDMRRGGGGGAAVRPAGRAAASAPVPARACTHTHTPIEESAVRCIH